MGTRPAETGSLTVGAIIAAIFVVYGWLKNGADFNDLTDGEVVGAITLIVSAVAALITWWIARRQRERELVSAEDGTVHDVPS